jgi:tripartite-type tricarboxylate transporter receptor subunit TctC
MRRWQGLLVLAVMVLVATACGRAAAPGAQPSGGAAQRSGAQGASAEPAPDFSGKTIRLIVGQAPGGGYDTYMRVIAQHITKHLPGNPTIVVENMTGGGSLVAANYVARRAKPDGLTVGDFASQLVIQAALGSKATQFTGKEFGWIGAPSPSIPVCTIMGFVGARSWAELVASGKEVRMGATRAGSTTGDLPRILADATPVKIRMVEGYDGTSEIRRAMLAREVDGTCWGWESASVTAKPMLEAQGDDKLIPILVEGKVDDPAFRDVPQISTVIRDPDDLSAFKAWLGPYEFQRPLALPPGTPAPILKAWREAFMKTMEDPAFLADTERAKLFIDAVSGERIDQSVAEIWKISPKAKESLQFLLAAE